MPMSKQWPFEFWQHCQGEGRLAVNLFIYNTGEGIQAILTGGEKPHVGGVVLAVPRLSIAGNGKASGDYYILPVPGHKDTIIGELAAKALVESFQVPVCVTAGVHSEQLTKEELDQIVENCRQLVLAAIQKLKVLNGES